MRKHLTSAVKRLRTFFSFMDFKGAVSRQSSSFCVILPITRPQSL